MVGDTHTHTHTFASEFKKRVPPKEGTRPLTDTTAATTTKKNTTLVEHTHLRTDKELMERREKEREIEFFFDRASTPWEDVQKMLAIGSGCGPGKAKVPNREARDPEIVSCQVCQG